MSSETPKQALPEKETTSLPDKPIPEKIHKDKDAKEKVEIKEHKDSKSEKLEKNELKEHKDSKSEKAEKNELKEHKDAKSEKLEKNEAKEFVDAKHHHVDKAPVKDKDKEGKETLEGPEGQNDGNSLAARVAVLEQRLEHFIGSDLRPNLSRGALSSEADGDSPRPVS